MLDPCQQCHRPTHLKTVSNEQLDVTAYSCLYHFLNKKAFIADTFWGH